MIDITYLGNNSKRWAEQKHLDRLWELDIMVEKDDGSVVCTHDIISWKIRDGAKFGESIRAGYLLRPPKTKKVSG